MIENVSRPSQNSHGFVGAPGAVYVPSDVRAYPVIKLRVRDLVGVVLIPVAGLIVIDHARSPGAIGPVNRQVMLPAENGARPRVDTRILKKNSAFFLLIFVLCNIRAVKDEFQIPIPTRSIPIGSIEIETIGIDISQVTRSLRHESTIRPWTLRAIDRKRSIGGSVEETSIFDGICKDQGVWQRADLLLQSHPPKVYPHAHVGKGLEHQPQGDVLRLFGLKVLVAAVEGDELSIAIIRG